MPIDPVLVLVSVDPEASHRANEAVRIALGLLAGENAVTLVLLGPAVKILTSAVEDCVDGDETVKHLAALKQLDQVIRVDRRASDTDGRWNPGALTVVSLSADELPRLVATAERILVF